MLSTLAEPVVAEVEGGITMRWISAIRLSRTGFAACAKRDTCTDDDQDNAHLVNSPDFVRLPMQQELSSRVSSMKKKGAGIAPDAAATSSFPRKRESR